LVSGAATVSFDAEADAMYYKLGFGRVAKSKKTRWNGLEYVIDFDRRGEIIGVKVLNMKKALALAASESMLILPPLKTVETKQPQFVGSTRSSVLSQAATPRPVS
jgi:uncharacterized protein YuzE